MTIISTPGIFKPALIEQAAAKVGVFGPQGSGKTTTSALLLIGLSLTYHKGAPVFFLDTENGSDYVKPIFDAEGVPLLVAKSRAFADMCAGLTEAERGGACGYLVDSYTHPWQELIEAFKQKSRRHRLEFEHMDELKSMWRQQWTTPMLNSPLHCVLSGRLAYVWDRTEPEEGERKGELIKLGTKMKSEAEAGYEPSLLIEMEGIQSVEARDRRTRRKRGTITHVAYVLKDRWRDLNGLSFTWPDMNSYKKGDWQKVFKPFAPHFAHLTIGSPQRAVSPVRTSGELFETDSAEFGRKRTIALEEIKESSTAVFAGQTASDKRARQILLDTLFGTLSWSKVETLGLSRLEASARILTAFKARAEADRDLVGTEEGLHALLAQCISAAEDDVLARHAAATVDDDIPAPPALAGGVL